ncbi:hypothetical protein GMORB2_3305 [Geosmithia morbida]|uniref:Uncharacterized protein n=1 Tax=Geosmithia morbida TaxID=1094350 RepID=A0A9P4YR54_9HYPO|nr:uncharacterized protein GMORB2_3305 [Geosmithia morbida]KAF4120178.1 hypothetical protein GMORB2_3305 [Geosmithia morbida]
MSQESHEGPASTNASENRSFHSGTGGFEHSTGHRVTAIDTNGDGHAKPEDTEQSSPKSKVKGWLRNRFSRGRPTGEEVDQYHHNQTTDKDKADGAAAAADDKSDRSSNKRRSLFWARGGSRGPSQSNASAASLDNGSTGDVAMSGRSSAPSVPGTSSRARRDSQGVSIASSVRDVESEEVGGGQDQERERFYDTVDMLPPPRPLGGPGSRMSVSPSPSRDSRFHEDID